MNSRTAKPQLARSRNRVAMIIAIAAGVCGSILTHGAARATASINETWALPADGDEGFVLVVGDDHVYTPRLQSAVVTVSASGSSGVTAFTVSGSPQNCPSGTSPIVGVTAWDAAVQATSSISATISGSAVGLDGTTHAFSVGIGPVDAHPRAEAGLVLPPVSVCEQQPDPEPSPTPTDEPDPEPSPTPTDEPDPEPEPDRPPTGCKKSGSSCSKRGPKK